MVTDDRKIIEEIFLMKVVSGSEYNWRKYEIEEHIRVEVNLLSETLLIGVCFIHIAESLP